MTKPTATQFVYSVHFKFGSRSPDERAFDKFRDCEIERMQTYGMNKGLSLIHISEPTRPY